MAERVQVRPISNEGATGLLWILRRGTGSVVTSRRAQTVLLSAQTMGGPQIARVTFTSEDRVRDVQRRRVRAGARGVEFDAGHHPFLSRPDAFAQTIAAEIDSAGSASTCRSTSSPYSPTEESRSDCLVPGEAVAPLP